MSGDTVQREAPNDNELEAKIEQHINKALENGMKLHGVTAGVSGGVGAVAYFEEDEGPELTKSQMQQLTKILGKGAKLPRGYKKQYRSMSQYLRDGINNSPDFAVKTSAAGEIVQKLTNGVIKANAYNTIDSESLGMMILPEFAPDIADILYDEQDLMGQTQKYTISGNSISLPKVPQGSRKAGSRNSGVSAGWPDEGDEISITRGKLESTELKLKKLAVVVFLNNELIEDQSYALEQWIKTCVNNEMKFLLNDAVINGTGGGMPMGYMQSGRCSKVTRTTANIVEARDILNIYNRRIPGVPLTEYEWHINQEVESDLFQMVMPAGGIQSVVYLPPGGLADSPHSKLMGLKVRTLEFCNARGTSGDIALVRMKGMTSINKGGINEMASSHVGFLRDQMAIRFTMRVDARPLFNTPTKAFKGASTFEYSDFVALT